MSTITVNSAMTLMERARREGYDGEAEVLGELAQVIEFLDEMPWFPSTHGDHNKQLQATRLGKGSFGAAYTAVPKITSGTQEITEPIKLYEGDSEVDERILAGSLNPALVRDSEDALNLEGALQDWVYNIFYANEGDTPDAFKSFTRRRPSILAKRVWSAGGTGSDLTSVWLMELGRRGVHLTYNPAGGQMPGISNEDRGRNKVDLPVGSGQYWAWIRHYSISSGVVLRNDRALLRYCNIDSVSGTAVFSPDTIIAMKAQLPSFGRNAVLMCGRTLRGQIDTNAYNKVNIAYGLVEITGYGPVSMVAGMPVRTVEPILEAETAVT